MSKIISLSSENVKRLHAVEITPKGNVVVIGGRNGQGKSSVLDSIQYALGGDPDVSMPVRKGEEKARVIVDLGDIVVRRTFTATGGTSLIVTDADGKKQATPQSILDRLVGRLTFDPLEFSRQKPQQQAETLRRLVGLDFAEQDKERARLYEERTAVNREVKNFEARIAGLPKHDAPAEEVNVASIMEEQRQAVEKNAAGSALKQAAEQANRDLVAAGDLCTSCERQIDELERKLEAARAQLAKAKEARSAASVALDAANKAAAEATFIPIDQFTGKLATAEETNRKVRANKARADLVLQLRQKQVDSEELTDKIDRIDAEKRKAIQAAKFPVPGLAFDVAGGVTFGGIPLDQASAAEQLRVSVAVGLALNPKLKVLLIRDGSLLDSDSLALVATMAAEADAQVWIERVGADEATSVIIEDGRVQEVKPKPEAQESLL